MARMNCQNPFAFTPMAVTFIVTAIYLSIAIPLIIIHETVPHAPPNPILYNGLNTTEAWLDLAELTNGYRPYNSHRNDDVRDWLLRRIECILKNNDIAWSMETKNSFTNETKSGQPHTDSSVAEATFASAGTRFKSRRSVLPAVTVFNDIVSNVTFSSLGSIGTAGQGRRPGQSIYFEGTNIIVYIRGTEEDDGEWWKVDDFGMGKSSRMGGVLVNAHYDSVSTGFGATDDGIGLITVLQLIRYFTTPGNEPKRGIVALLNNGEEDYLNGARAYTQHPISKFAYTFLNLEGAGAGGRATLFRSTDTEVTRAYATVPNPFGTVVSADGFKAGAVRSQTDYVVFTETLGLRGLDVAFWYPRARYHTDQDDTKHTSINSLWHMLQASVYTMKALSSDTSGSFSGPRGDGAKGKVKNGSGSEAVWFDLFGKAFALFELRTLFAWSLTLLIASPLILIVMTFLLVRRGKLYFFASKVPQGEEGTDTGFTTLDGWRGLSRFPIAFIVTCLLTIGSAFLIKHTNPLIIYSSVYAVWSMMLSLYFVSFWVIMRGADTLRPSALHRGYAILWMYILGWALLVAATVFEDRFQIATGYLFVFLEASLFLAAFITLCEFFTLPSKLDYSLSAREENITRNITGVLPDSDALIAPGPDEIGEDQASETTPLFGGDGASSSRGTTFAYYARRSLGGGGDSANDDTDHEHQTYSGEQGWSSKMVTWTWLIQFLLVGPFILVVVGQVALLVIEAISQTAVDGSSELLPYTATALFSILLLFPVGPFVHRFTYHIPFFLFMIFFATLIYNMVAFPFSANNRYKAYFLQTVDLETGQNQVALLGLEDYIKPIIASLPSAAGKSVICINRWDLRSSVRYCSWDGLAPNVVGNMPDGVPPERDYKDWVTYNVSRTSGQNSARFVLSGTNTRACVLRFDRPIKDFSVLGGSKDDRFDAVSEMGSDQIRLWHREWDQPWTVDVEWPVGKDKSPGDEGMEGKVVCLWSDNNVEGAIPALDEIRRFAPVWSAITKAQDGLVEGVKRFVI